MTVRMRGIIGLAGLLALSVWLAIALSQVVAVSRRLDPGLLELPPGYKAELVTSGLDSPVDVDFDETGAMYVVESGAPGVRQGRVVRFTPSGERQDLVAGLEAPATGVTPYHGLLYIAHRGKVSRWDQGATRDVIGDLPSLGDNGNSKVAFGPDGKMYFGQGTATNSGVVGPDNKWLTTSPKVHDVPARTLTLTGQNFATDNPLPPEKGRPKEGKATTGAFLPFATPSRPGQVIPGGAKPNGAVFRANSDGTGVEVMAWGFHNPSGVAFSPDGRLWVTNRGMSAKGSRPIANAPDEFHEIIFGGWYGWPDFAGGEPVNRARFTPEGAATPRLLMASYPAASPLQPLALFPPPAGAGLFDFSPGGDFGFKGQAFIPLTGSGSSKIVRIDLEAGRVHDFLRNGQGKAGGETQATVLVNLRAAHFGPDGSLYLVDAGPSRDRAGEPEWLPGGGAIWRVRPAEAGPNAVETFPEVPGLGLDKIALGLVIGVAIGAVLARAPIKRRRRRI